jgi:hypothetical protein
MNERDAARAQSESLHQAGRDSGNERRAARMDRTLQRYLASAYYAILARRTSRTHGDAGGSRRP